VALNADGSKAYVANSTSGNVSVITTGTNAVTATLTGGGASVTLHSKVQLGAALKGVAAPTAAAVIATPKAGMAAWVWALIGLGIVLAFGFILVMVIRYERRRAASHRA
jgi:YVTN family beta-propeller protein